MHLCRRFILSSALALACVGLPTFALAQEPKPVAVVSVAPLDRLMKDVTFLMRAANFPEVAGVARVMVDGYTLGIDKSKPWGVTITLEDEMPAGILFLPITDREQLFGTLATAGIEPDDLGDGLWEVDANGQVLYAKDANGWLFIAQSEAALASVPADPSAALGEMPNKYDLAIRVNVQALPEEMRSMAAEQMRLGFERTLAEQSEEQQAAAREAGEAQLAQLEQLMNETDQVIFGWAIEPSAQRTYIDSAAQFVEGSELAAQMDDAKNVTSDFTAFKLPSPSASFRATSEIKGESDKAVMKMSIENSMTQAMQQLDDQGVEGDARKVVDQLMTTIQDLLVKTIDEGKFDSVATVSVADDTLRVLVGGRIADGNALANELVELINSIPSGPEKPVAEFNYETFEGVTLHRLKVPVKIADPGARKAFGDELNFVIGTADKAVMVAMDPSGDAMLKAAIQQMQAATEKKVQPLEGVVEVGSILRYIQSISPNSMLDLATEAIDQYAGKDKVQIAASAIPRGVIYRFTLEEGVLKAVGSVAKAGGAGGGGGF